MIGYPDEGDVERWRSSDAAVMRADLDRALVADVENSPRSTDRPPSDTELIEAVRGGTIEAYAQLYMRHVHAAQNLARQLAKSAIEADDLVADAFAKVLSALRAGGGPGSSFRAYLLTALRHTAYDKTRRDRKVELADDVEAISGAERVTRLPFHDTAVTKLDNSLIVRAFASLPERWQTVLWHTEIEGQTPAEVAPLLGLSPNGVSATAYRAREGLRKAYLQAHVTHNPPERCRAAAAKLGSWTRRGLSRRETAQVEVHLDQCVACRALAAELADVNGALRGTIAPLVLGAGAAGYLAAGAGKGSAAVALAASSSSSVIPLVGAAVSTAALVVAVVVGTDTPERTVGPTAVADPPVSASTNQPPGSTGPLPSSSAPVVTGTAPQPPPTGASAPGQSSAAAPSSATRTPVAAPALAPDAPSTFTTSTGGPPTRLPITIRNSGSAPAPPPTLTLSLPDDVKVVGPGDSLLGEPLLRLNGAAQGTIACPAGKGAVTCKAEQQLAPGGSATFVFRLLAGPKAVGGTIVATTDSTPALRMEIRVTITPKK
ncbi:sigma-70 family RNA polymerase sigma factor [Kibdelosporangium aridum]|uniref:RNA polymerase sigma factor, sigma-70 family n=1 Tax=Kibdelosporangium aridum TaxID=2030 RepID=A0A1Y5Y4S3_KIBAR|nr:sigma-70 family RNA polymerase sigma factor [Kibdelosporangium aridum]SMD24940.1 RNA polymerase sigma factor, sigma-70 family [Kibdelosporangium aridum]